MPFPFRMTSLGLNSTWIPPSSVSSPPYPSSASQSQPAPPITIGLATVFMVLGTSAPPLMSPAGSLLQRLRWVFFADSRRVCSVRTSTSATWTLYARVSSLAFLRLSLFLQHCLLLVACSFATPTISILAGWNASCRYDSKVRPVETLHEKNERCRNQLSFARCVSQSSSSFESRTLPSSIIFFRMLDLRRSDRSC